MRIPTSIAPGSSKSSLFTQDFHRRVQMNIVAKLFGKKKRKVVADCNCLMLFTNKHRALCFAFHLVAYKEKSIVWFIKLANKELLESSYKTLKLNSNLKNCYWILFRSKDKSTKEDQSLQIYVEISHQSCVIEDSSLLKSNSIMESCSHSCCSIRPQTNIVIDP
jgi:hypothetical protein